MKTFYSCTCADTIAGSPCLRKPPEQPVAIDKRRGWVLFTCDTCGGLIAVSIDGTNVIIQQLSALNIRIHFEPWLKAEAAKTEMPPDKMAEAIAHSAGISCPENAGCDLCRDVHPYEPDPDTILTFISDEGYGRLYQCPRCGLYRWRYTESHEFAEIPVWGCITRETLAGFGSFLEKEASAKNLSREEIMSSILTHSIV